MSCTDDLGRVGMIHEWVSAIWPFDQGLCLLSRSAMGIAFPARRSGFPDSWRGRRRCDEPHDHALAVENDVTKTIAITCPKVRIWQSLVDLATSSGALIN
jgi:hypothetical protein